MTEGIVEFDDWQKLDLRVGQIIEVEDIEGADKLYKIVIDVGSDTEDEKSSVPKTSERASAHETVKEVLGKRTVCAGLKQYYSKEDLMNKRVILFVNLTPRKMRGIESQGMILAAVSDNESKVRLIQPDAEIEVGSRVM